MGLANPRSRTRAGDIFNDYLNDSVVPGDQVLFCMGEVDCGFVIWYRAAKHGMDVESQFAVSLNNYLALIDHSRLRTDAVIVTSVPLPTIKEGESWGSVANERKEVTATLIERTKLTRRYNEQLRRHCAQLGVAFLDLERHTLNSNTGMVHETFRHPNPTDHHLDAHRLKPILKCELRKMGVLR